MTIRGLTSIALTLVLTTTLGGCIHIKPSLVASMSYHLSKDKKRVRPTPQLRDLDLDPKSPEDLMEITERIRGHNFKEPVVVRSITNQRMLDAMVGHQRTPPGRPLTMKALGLDEHGWAVNPDVDGTDGSGAEGKLSYERCFGGFYDPDTATVFLCDTTMRLLSGEPPTAVPVQGQLGSTRGRVLASPDGYLVEPIELQQKHLQQLVAEHILVHELVHALQHQLLGLKTAIAQDATTDAMLARIAVIEGDADFTATAVWKFDARGLQRARPGLGSKLELWVKMRRNGLLVGSRQDGVPTSAIAAAAFRYASGMRFAGMLYERWGWPAVDAAHFAPPTSTAQILHPVQFMAGWTPQEVVVPQLQSLESKGYRPVGTDTVGELMFGAYLAGGRWYRYGRDSVAGWRGDQVRIYVAKEDQLASVWLSTWSDEETAWRIGKATLVVHKYLPAREMARAMVVQVGRRLLIVRGVDPSLHAAVRAEMMALLGAQPTGGAP